MRPTRFEPSPLPGDERFCRDGVSGLVYNRAFNRVLYADTDRSNVVYHANYLRYFEYGRANLMRDVGFPYAEVEASGYVYPIFDLALQYFEPLRYDDPFQVYTRTGDIDRVRIQFDYVITHAERGCLVCRGHTRHCALNPRGKVVEVDPITVRTWQNFPR
jgi:acyl-CoA thioester hydrolase